jgi:hypothetical protein
LAGSCVLRARRFEALARHVTSADSPRSYSAIDVCALRSRRQSTAITALMTSGSFRSGRKFQLARENVRRSLAAFTVAVRDPPSSKAISPTASPGPNSARREPPTSTSAVPSMMRKNRPAPSPSATTSAPARNDISLPASRILFSCFCGRSRNSSARCSAASISLSIRLTFQINDDYTDFLSKRRSRRPLERRLQPHRHVAPSNRRVSGGVPPHGARSGSASRTGANTNSRACTALERAGRGAVRKPSTPHTNGSNVAPITTSSPGDRARSAHDHHEVEGEVLELEPLTSHNDVERSGGETRTLNLAVNSRLLCH